MIDTQKIIPLIMVPVAGSIEGLLLEIRELRGKIEEADHQSFYFQLGVSSNKDKLSRMVRKYEKYMRLVNGNSREYFILQLITARGEAQKAGEKCRKRPSMPNLLALSACEGGVKELRSLYQAKRKFTTLPALPGDTSVSGYESRSV